MSEQLQSENRSTLVGIAALMAFPYIWLGLFVLLYWLYYIGFFGRDLGSLIMLGVLGLLFLIPAIPFALTRFLVRPLFSNLLGREVITTPGCITGLVCVASAGVAAIYFLSRGVFETVGLLLLLAPVVGSVLAGGVSLITRGGGLSLPRGRTKTPQGRRVEKLRSPRLPQPRRSPSLSAEKRSSLPSPKKDVPSSSKPPRRRSRPSSSSSRPSPPPRRK